jgi:hypothetical protein
MRKGFSYKLVSLQDYLSDWGTIIKCKKPKKDFYMTRGKIEEAEI